MKKLSHRHRPKHAPTYAPEPYRKSVCTEFKRCKGCPYPNHGLRCWHSDGSCLRTDMETINRREKGRPS